MTIPSRSRYVCPNQTQFPFQNGHLVKSEWGRIEIVDGKHQWVHLANWCVTCNIQGIEDKNVQPTSEDG